MNETMGGPNEKEQSSKHILVIGAGGIGSTLLHTIIPACERICVEVTFTVMDADIVEATNLGHQRYDASDIGLFKVDALSQRFYNAYQHVQCDSLPENLRDSSQLSGYDAYVICVDRPEPRRLIHQLDAPWIDLRCAGDGWCILTNQSNPALVAHMTPDHEPKSCQVEGALELGNIEFGFAVCAAYGAQWLLQSLREAPSFKQSMGSMTYGQLAFPEVNA